ncbi:MAG TPA: hypothetical protein VFN02_04295 [Ktedonobacteraceae bacterium]|nr:hypothetical protein [Ktedonobacteraceae bacterium]
MPTDAGKTPAHGWHPANDPGRLVSSSGGRAGRLGKATCGGRLPQAVRLLRALLVVMPEEALGYLSHLTKRGGQTDEAPIPG